MEEPADARCSVVYLWLGSGEVRPELYDAAHVFNASPNAGSATSSHQHIARNARRLLDTHQGDFYQVAVSSNSTLCSHDLQTTARTRPTLLLVDVGHKLDNDECRDHALSVLRKLLSSAASDHQLHRTMPFILASPASLGQNQPPARILAPCLDAGAIGVASNDLSCDDVAKIVSDVKELTRPSARDLGCDMARGLVESIHNTSRPKVAIHRPDLVLSAERRAVVESAIARWHFPAHDLCMDELSYGAVLMLEHVLRNPELEAYRLPRPELMTFVLSTRRRYSHERHVRYHNWRHAVDVTQSLYCFLCDVRLCPPEGARLSPKKEMNALERLFTPYDALILLVSAVGHDVGHPGVNNAFLVASNHNLAHMYNDKSVLENYHCSAYSQILRRHWPALLQAPRFRSTMISTILATDMQRHFEYMGQLSDLKQKMQSADAELSEWNEKDKEHAKDVSMALLIKAADISNVARPFEISARWAGILMNEFSRQGELESELQIPTCLFGGPPVEEDLLAAAQSQKGFMNLFGFPLFRGLCEVMPNVSCTLPELENNKDIWERRIADEMARRESSNVPAPPTYDVPKAEVKEARHRKRESEPTVVPIEVPQTPSKEIRRHPAMNTSGSPVRHPASEQRLHLSIGASATDHKRASTPYLSTGFEAPLSPVDSSRRSSKDVALTQLHDYSVFAQLNMKQNLQPDSRRGSADASWAIHQSYPGSRRGSKDESLTTIVVTSGANHGNRTAPGSPTKANKSSVPGKGGNGGPRSALVQKQQPSSQSQLSSIPSRPQTVSSGTATMSQHSPSTQPSSIDTIENDSTMPPATAVSSSKFSDGDPFSVSVPWLQDGERVPPLPPMPTSANSAPSTPVLRGSKSDSPRVLARLASGDSEEVSRLRLGKPEGILRESRSRSRLRGLKFWKKRRDFSGVEHTSGESSP